MTRSPACPLCLSFAAGPFEEAHGRRYHRCRRCALVFMEPEQRPTEAAEREHYATHHNDPADPGYRRFLNRLCEPLVERLPLGARGLDYGAGPGPALAAMLREQGFPTAVYDPLFAADEEVLREAYDFVTCTEAAEHFFHPAREFARLVGLLRPGGWLGVMTETLEEGRSLADWRYARDPTHVCLYSAGSLEWIAREHGLSLESPQRNVFLMRRAARAGSSAPP